MNPIVTTISLWQFVLAVAASALAIFLGTTIVELLKNWSLARSARRELKTQLSIEFEQLSKLLQRLKLEYQARSYFPIGFLNLAAGELGRIEDNLARSALLKNVDLQRKLFETTTDCRAVIAEITGAEQILVEKGVEPTKMAERLEYVTKLRPEKSVDLSDLNNRLGDLIRELK